MEFLDEAKLQPGCRVRLSQPECCDSGHDPWYECLFSRGEVSSARVSIDCEDSAGELGLGCGAATPARAVLTMPGARITIRNSFGTMTRSANVVQLKPETEKAFDEYVRDAETAMEQVLHGPQPFLWADAIPERAQQVRRGRIVAQFWGGQGPTKVPNGLIHDWIGAEFIPGTTIESVLGVVQNYDHHKTIYKPEVLDSALISRHENDFKIRLRLLKKKVVTVVLDTDHEVHYWPVDRKRWVCLSHTTRVAEVENAGSPNERVLPPDTGHGFLWRLNSYWKFEEKKEGVYVECRGISLTRDVPFGLGWLIEPIIQKLPGESLVHTLEATRLALLSRERHTRHSSTTA